MAKKRAPTKGQQRIAKRQARGLVGRKRKKAYKEALANELMYPTDSKAKRLMRRDERRREALGELKAAPVGILWFFGRGAKKGVTAAARKGRDEVYSKKASDNKKAAAKKGNHPPTHDVKTSWWW